MTEVFIRVDAAGQHQCYRTLNGRYALDIGPAFRTPKEAMAYAESIDPLRAGSGEPFSTAPVAPARGAAGMDGSPDGTGRHVGSVSLTE